MRKTTGRSWMPAKFIASCQSPWLVEASPPEASTTPSSPRILKARALPVAGAHPQSEHDTVVAVVGVDVVVAGAQGVGGADLAALLALAGDHESRLPLAVEDPGPLVHPASEEH